MQDQQNTDLLQFDDSTSFRGNNFIKPASTTELVTLEDFKKYTEEIITCSQDIKYFANNYYSIINLDKGKTIIKLYEKQAELIKFLAEPNNKRVICCASRQSGKTTSYSIYFCHLCCFSRDKKVLILANKSDTAKGILNNIKMAFELLPKWLKPGVVEWNKMSIKFANGCSIEVCTTSSDAARSKSVNILCIDEVAFIDKNLLEKVWTSVYPIVSSSKNSKVILVSTPNGTSNLFYKICQRARSDLENDEAWKYFQIDWTDVPGRDDEWRQQQLESFNGDLVRFNQEFGNCVIGSTVIEVLDTFTNTIIKIPIEKLYELLEKIIYNVVYKYHGGKNMCKQEKFDGCKNLQKLLEAQTKVMRRHVDKHKWFKHIENIDEALIDFTEAYAWLMREIFCTECCPYRENCKMFDELVKEKDESK